MSDFGDWEPDDAFGTEPVDPRLAAIKLHRLRRDEGFDDGLDWDELTESRRERLLVVMQDFVEWWRRQGLR